MTHYRIISDATVSRLVSATRDYFSIGPVPAGEACVQAGPNFSKRNNVLESSVLIDQLIRLHGEPPEGAEFFILRNTGHDYGEYYEAAIFYKDDDEAEEEHPSLEYANKCENLPELWDALSLKQLKEENYSLYETPVIQMRHTG